MRRFTDIRQQAEGEIGQLGKLGGEETRLIAELAVKLRERQLHRFLENYSVETAKIKGLGDGRKAILRSYGIDTAADVSKSRIEAISGFGPASSASLMDWRASLEKKFNFDPRQPVNPADVNRIKKQIDQQRSQLEQTLRSRLAELRTAAADIQKIRQSAISQATTIWKDIKQAEADELAAQPSVNLVQRRWLFGILFVLTLVVSGFINASRRSSSETSTRAPAINSSGGTFPPINTTTWPPNNLNLSPTEPRSPFPPVPPIKGAPLATVPRMEMEKPQAEQKRRAGPSIPTPDASQKSTPPDSHASPRRGQ